MGGAQRRLGRQPDPCRRARILGVAPQAKVRTTTTPYPLDKANEALDDLRKGALEGAAVLVR
jgi:D-arabinose 1-dehydrogenase-like Zn-dependent alcohol dehydrogenase